MKGCTDLTVNLYYKYLNFYNKVLLPLTLYTDMYRWSNVEADLVCKKNGFAGGAPYLVPDNKKTKPPILMSNVRCVGSEADLDKCTFTPIGQPDTCPIFTWTVPWAFDLSSGTILLSNATIVIHLLIYVVA
jgi:hypothetical protein